MNAVIDAAFTRSRVVLTALVVLIFFGLTSYRTIPREADPDILAPFIGVTLPLPGISPEDGERLLVRPTELELQKIEGLIQMDSVASDGAANITLEFETTIDVDQAVLDVREAVDRARADYPADAEEPIVIEFNLQNEYPILTTILYGQAPERTLYNLARDLEDKLATAPGVLEARLTGAREELMEVVVSPEVLESYGVTEFDVLNAVSNNNRLIAAGAVRTADGEFAIKAPGLVKSADDLSAIAIKGRNSEIVTIGDIGEARRTFKDRTGYVLFNGEPAIGVEVSKRGGANIVETINAARAIVEKESENWPDAVQYKFIGDQSVFVRDALGNLTGSVVTAVLLVMIVVVAALGLRSGLMVGIAIPSTFLIAFFLLDTFGYTLNMMVMFGLVLAVGMLVDGAIVVIEFADRRMAEGAERITAFREAAKRMLWPVTTSTATTIAAFVPFLFWDSLPGQYMRYLPLTMMFILSASLFVALIFLPVTGSIIAMPQWLKNLTGSVGKTDAPAVTAADDADPRERKDLMGAYSRFLTALIRRPFLVIAVAFCVLAACITTFRAVSPDTEFFLRSDDEQINVFVLGRGNLAEAQKLELAESVAARIEDHPSIADIYLQTGDNVVSGRSTPAETIARLTVNLIYYSEREHSNIVAQELRDLVRGTPGVVIEVRPREAGPPVGKDVQVEIRGRSFDAMIAAATAVRNFVDDATVETGEGEVHAYMDAEDTLPLPGIEWAMNVDRALAGQYGLSVQQAGAVLQFVTNGLLIDQYRPDDSKDEIDIRIRYPKTDRTLGTLDTVRIQTPAGAVPISNFVTREARPQIDRINRRNGERIIEIFANGNTQDERTSVSQGEAISIMKKWLESGALGDDVEWVMRGAEEDTADATAFFQAAMAASLFMIAMILLLEFNSFYHSVLTLSSVIFAVIGTMFCIALSGQYISTIMTGVGIVALAGIVVNNNIVLIDTFQSLRRKGIAIEEAVVRTAAQRARPVLLTTTTTILGLLPMVFELNVDYLGGRISIGSSTSDWWVLLSSAVVYGLAFSTLLTLILTPVFLAAPSVIKANITERFFSDGAKSGAQKSLPPAKAEAASYPSAAE